MPSLGRRVAFRTFAFVRLLVLVVALGGLVGAGIGYGIGRIFDNSNSTSQASGSAGATTPATQRVQRLTVPWVATISRDGKAHFHNAVKRVADGSSSTGIFARQSDPKGTGTGMVGLKFDIHPSTTLTKVVVKMAGVAGPESIWLVSDPKGGHSAKFDDGHRLVTYQGSDNTVTLQPDQPITDSQHFEIVFAQLPPVQGKKGQYGVTPLEIVPYGYVSASDGGGASASSAPSAATSAAASG